MLGLQPKSLLSATWNLRSYCVFEIFYIIKIILFLYFGLKIFFLFGKMRFGDQDTVVVRVFSSSPSCPYIKGTYLGSKINLITPEFLNTLRGRDTLRDYKRDCNSTMGSNHSL